MPNLLGSFAKSSSQTLHAESSYGMHYTRQRVVQRKRTHAPVLGLPELPPLHV